MLLINPNVLENRPNKMIHKRCFKKCNEGLFQTIPQKTKWWTILKNFLKTILKTLDDIILSFSQLIPVINGLLDTHAPFKYFKSKINEHNKPWITTGVTTSTKKENNLLKKFCQAKDPKQKSKLWKQYKVFKNHIMKLSRKSKESHF